MVYFYLRRCARVSDYNNKAEKPGTRNGTSHYKYRDKFTMGVPQNLESCYLV